MSHKSYKDVWAVTGKKTTGAFKDNLPLGHIGLAVQSSKGMEFIDPATLGTRKFKDEKLVLLRGTNGSYNTFESTMPIASMEFLGIKYPQEYKPASVQVGYDGADEVNANKTISFEGGAQTFAFQFFGSSLTMLGIPKNQVVFYHTFGPNLSETSTCTDECATTPCKPYVEAGILEVLNKPVGNFGHTVGDFATVTPIYGGEDCAGAIPTTDVTYYTLTKCDSGSDYDLAEVQASITNANVYGKVWRSGRDGSISTYKVATTSAVPSAGFVAKVGSVIKGCADCPAGTTTVPGGYVYTVKLEDNGTAVLSTVELLANAVVGSAARIGSEHDLGIYTVSLTEELSTADLATFIATNATTRTAQVEFEGYQAAALCVNATPSAITWVTTTEVCKIGTQTYRIVLKDDECGNSRLAELQAAYPDFDVTEVTMSPPVGNCRNIYEATVPTNVVCPECDETPIVLSTTPSEYMGERWYSTATATEGVDCKCGFSVKMKDIRYFPPICLSDGIGFIKPELNVSIKKAVPTESGNINDIESTQSPHISIDTGVMGTQWGVDFLTAERVNHKKQNGLVGHTQSDQYMLGQSSLFETHKQYPVAMVKITSTYLKGGASNRLNEEFVISMPLIDTSVDTMNYIKKLNYNN